MTQAHKVLIEEGRFANTPTNYNAGLLLQTALKAWRSSNIEDERLDEIVQKVGEKLAGGMRL